MAAERETFAQQLRAAAAVAGWGRPGGNCVPPTASALPAKLQRELIDGAGLAGGTLAGGHTMIYGRGQTMSFISEMVDSRLMKRGTPRALWTAALDDRFPGRLDDGHAAPTG